MFDNRKVYKILVAGSFGSGKTTFVKTVSEIDPLLTEKKITHPDELSENKKTTTVAMDMGKIKIGDEIEIHLFSAPGQERFNFMIDILKRGIIGAVIMVDAASPKSIKEAAELAKYIRSQYEIPILFAVTKLDLPHAKSLDEIKAHLEDDDFVKVMPLDPRDKEQGKKVLLELLGMVLQ
jgi:small GTP-binding protein